MGILAPAPVRAMSVEIVTAYKSLYINDITISPFPAGAGMNRLTKQCNALPVAVPRRRGDEPQQGRLHSDNLRRSPQARG